MLAPKKLLVANRSEIAIRVFRAATELGSAPWPFTRRKTAFASIASRRTKPTSSARAKGRSRAYLDIEGIVALAKEKGVWSVHPGLRVFGENARFARACATRGIIFVGPRRKFWK